MWIPSGEFPLCTCFPITLQQPRFSVEWEKDTRALSQLTVQLTHDESEDFTFLSGVEPWIHPPAFLQIPKNIRSDRLTCECSHKHSAKKKAFALLALANKISMELPTFRPETECRLLPLSEHTDQFSMSTEAQKNLNRHKEKATLILKRKVTGRQRLTRSVMETHQPIWQLLYFCYLSQLPAMWQFLFALSSKTVFSLRENADIKAISLGDQRASHG